MLPLDVQEYIWKIYFTNIVRGEMIIYFQSKRKKKCFTEVFELASNVAAIKHAEYIVEKRISSQTTDELIYNHIDKKIDIFYDELS